MQKQAGLPLACNSSSDLQPPIDSGRAFSLLSDTLSSSICISQTQNDGKLLTTTPHSSTIPKKDNTRALTITKKYAFEYLMVTQNDGMLTESIS